MRAPFPISTSDIYMLASALVRATDAHGAPNTFGCAELEREFRAPVATRSGLIGRQHLAPLQSAVRDHGATFVVTYTSKRRFLVEPAGG